jgi:hypothetical protein
LRATAERVCFALIARPVGCFPAFSRTFAQRGLWAARADAESFRVPVPFAYVLPNTASAAVMS